MSRFDQFLVNKSEIWNNVKKNIFKDCSKILHELRGSDELLYRATNSKIFVYDIKTSRLSDRKPLDTPVDIHNELNYWFKKKFGWNVRNGVFATFDIDNIHVYGTAYIFLPIGDYEYAWSKKISDLYSHGIITYNVAKKWYDEGFGGRFEFYVKGRKIIPTAISTIEDVTKAGKYKAIVVNGMPSLNLYKGDTVTVEVEDVPFDIWCKNRNIVSTKDIKNIVDTYTNKDLKKAGRNEISFNCDKYYLIDREYSDDILAEL